jgi:hypothetical protein
LVSDPTLLLEYKERTEIAEQSELTDKGKYLLTYYPSDPLSKKIKRIAKDHNLKVINLFNQRIVSTYMHQLKIF